MFLWYVDGAGRTRDILSRNRDRRIVRDARGFPRGILPLLPSFMKLVVHGTVFEMEAARAAGANVYDDYLDFRDWRRDLKDDVLNYDGEVMPLKDVRWHPDGLWMRPLLLHKSFNGRVIDSEIMLQMIKQGGPQCGLRDCRHCPIEASSPKPETLVIVARPKVNINNQRRFWVVGRNILKGTASYMNPGSMHEKRKLLQRIVDKVPADTYSVDIVSWMGKEYVGEFNGVSFAGIIGIKDLSLARALVHHVERHGKTVGQLRGAFALRASPKKEMRAHGTS